MRIGDDDASLLESLSDMLKIRIPTPVVETFATGRDGLGWLEAHECDVVICDLQMADMDGFGVLSHVQKIRPQTPVLFISGVGYLAPELAKRAIEAGAYDFIPKPIDRDLFDMSIKRAMEAHRLRVNGHTYPAIQAVLCLQNLPLTWTLLDLKALCAPFGRVRWARLISDQNGHSQVFGYVEMMEHDTVKPARAALNGKIIEGKAICVSLCTDLIQRRAF